MIVKYNSLNRLEAPKLTLCNPGSVYNSGALTKTVGILTDHEAEEIVFNFNAVSELNFRINNVTHDDPEDNIYLYNMYKSVQNRRLIFVDGIGYFMISNIKDGFDNGIHYKDVTAKSIEYEIEQKMIPYIEDGTYRFQTYGTENGLLEKIVKNIPLWTIGYVDPKVTIKYRTFEDVDTSLNCLSFMMEKMQDAYECIFIFDIINRKINVYDQSNYVKQTDIHITKKDLINSIYITENADDLYTAINVMGDNNITISAINPIGTNVIYNFSHYLEWMSNSLREKVVQWNKEINRLKEQYYNYNLKYFEMLEEYNNLSLDRQKFEIQIKMYTKCRDNIIASSDTNLVGEYNKVILENEGTAIEIKKEITDTIAGIDDKISELENKIQSLQKDIKKMDNNIESQKKIIDSINEYLAISKYFTEEEFSELSHYIFEGSYTDEYVVITDSMTHTEQFEQMNNLYNRAESRLERISQPTQEFDIDVENFLFIKEFEHFSEQLETGCLINVELDIDNIAMLFLSTITVNYDDHSLNLTFGNRFNKYDPRSLFNDILGDVSKSANSINYIKEILYPIKNGEFNVIKEALQSSRNLTMGNAISSENEEVVIDGSGYTGRRLKEDGTYEAEQIKLTSSNIVFTDDSWNTSQIAIGKISLGDGEDGQDEKSVYGINAKVLIGDLIIGNQLKILDENRKDIFTVVDGKIASSVDSFNIRINAIEDREISSIVTESGYSFDDEGLRINKSGEELESIINHTGMRVKRCGNDILIANDNGVEAMNMVSKQYLIIGNHSRFEDYYTDTNTKRTACYFINSSE